MNFKHFVLISSVISGMHLGASAASYKWANGSTNLAAQAGVYGDQGIASASNMPGGRYGTASGAAGTNLWMFGGLGYDKDQSYTVLNDLWKYDTTTEQWTWVSGLNTGYGMANYGAPGTAMPGARAYHLGWNDSSGNFWIFGGFGANDTDFGLLNDLWKFDGTQWTWVGGTNTLDTPGVYDTLSTKLPGGRLYSVSTLDGSGNVWVFGGFGMDSEGSQGYLNDLWKYNPSNNQWTWVSGSKFVNQKTVNSPGGRGLAAAWADGTNIWVFGGSGYDEYGNFVTMNDLWKFDTANNEWTKVSGSSSDYQSGVYGTKGSPALGNIPGARYSPNFWKGSDGNLWLFGGAGRDGTGDSGMLSDLWRYDLTSGLWTWYAGKNTAAQSGTWGTQGVGNADNIPSSRYMSTSFKTSSGTNFWLFGGLGKDAHDEINLLSDLWNLTY